VVALSKRVIFILAFAMVLVAALLYQVDYLVSRSISQPIRLLSDRLQTVRSVEPRIEFPDFRANDELQYLKESMEAMFSGLQASTQELIDSRTREINAHYEALQSQINPHFLHNLFAVMGSIARAEGSSTLVTTCREASSMFRYISKKEPSLVTIRDEIAYARNYVFLMEQRFEDGLEVEFDIDDEMLELYVPKLFLQPIIENCYAHGFKKIPQPWRIRVTGAFGPPQLNEWSGAPGQRRWLVRVEDNGSGFDSVYDGIECTAGAGCRLPDSAGGSGVGLRNIWERFCIHFKESSVLRIGNIRSNGTTSGAIVEIGGATF
jgi:sensor histidine kinase YesM